VRDNSRDTAALVDLVGLISRLKVTEDAQRAIVFKSEP
jgi:hypothetical protein